MHTWLMMCGRALLDFMLREISWNVSEVVVKVWCEGVNYFCSMDFSEMPTSVVSELHLAHRHLHEFRWFTNKALLQLSREAK